jgi:PAS domain S-box-containing protein
MIENNNPVAGELSEAELAHQQALKYGEDLARVFMAEKAKREKLEIAYQALDAIFNSTPDSLVVLNDAFVITQANAAFGQLVEMASPAVVGKPIVDVLDSEQLLQTLQALATADTASMEVELSLIRPVKRSLLLNIARLQAGRLGGWVVVLHDQTRRKRLEHQKAEFINIASHELRTPLAAMLGYGEMLLESITSEPDGGNPEYREYTEALLKGSYRLNNIVKELVQFAELSQGDIPAAGIREFKVADILASVIADVQRQADERQVKINISISDPALQMVADPTLLRTALYQLILNGIIFNSPQGSINIELEPIGGRVSIKIADTGIGISRSDLETIFHPFYQAEPTDIRRIGGLGLGLSITQRAVAQLGGHLTVDSVLGQGSTFTMQLPIQQPTPDTELIDLQAQLTASYQQSIVYARDVQSLYRELQQAHKQLQEINLQLEESNKLKSNFLSVVSHELRSPFVSVDFALQTIPRYGMDQLKQEQRELFEQLTRGIDEARLMIDNLVKSASLLSKQGRLNLTTFDVSQLVSETADSLRPMAETRGLDLQVQAPQALILPQGDRERIGEAVWHLIHNAIKFTKTGGQIVVRAHTEPDNLVIEVKDTGIGIAPEHQARVWESFSQVSDSLKRGMEGLGLGLALVRYVAAAHGGQVILQSEFGLGSVFGFWLPMAPRKADTQAETD